MKKIVVSVGMAAFSVLPLSASSLSDLAASANKPWSLSATLRGFWDDNVNGTKDNKTDSFGFEVSPAVGLNWAAPQTTVNLGFLYSMKYYDKNIQGTSGSDHYDQSFTFTALADHRFSERYHVNFKDSFVIGQEPDLLRAGETTATYQRISGSNIRNYFAGVFDAQITPLLSLSLGYEDALYRYDYDAAPNPNGGPNRTVTIFIPATGFYERVIPSYAGSLDRNERTVHLDSRWTIQPTTIGVVGVQAGWVDYTAGQLITYQTLTPDPVEVAPVVPGGFAFSNWRNNQSIYGYVGADHTFRPDLTGSVRAGARYTDYYNDPSNTSDVSPYVRLALTYVYRPQSTVSMGFSYDRTATDQTSFDPTKSSHFTLDYETATVWLALSYAITPRLIASGTGQFQNSTWNGGAIDGQVDRYYTLGVNLSYQFNPHFSTEIGYNYDKLDSDVPNGLNPYNRTFDRNRAYVGVTATW